MDKFLISIYNVLTEKKRVDKTLQALIAKNKLMAVYKGEEGFEEFVHDMMLDDYLDYYKKPTVVFPFVWSSMKDLDKDTYFNAVDVFSSFCETFIPKRADIIIKKLINALSETPNKKETVSEKAMSNYLNRYALAYELVTECVDIVSKNIEQRLPALIDKEYYVTLTKKLGLLVEGFTWNDFSVDIEKVKDDFIVIFYTFPKPEKEPEALYGAVLFDRYQSTLTYYTLEKCHHPGCWALGKNTTDCHSLMGMFDIEPTKGNFLKLIIPELRDPEDLDIKSILKLPERFEVLEKRPEDPVCCVNYLEKSPSCISFIQAYPISYRKAMPLDDTTIIIDSIHQSLADNQALIEVKNGKTKNGRKYAYSIVKIKAEPIGVNYYMVMQTEYNDDAICIKARFVERGMTGVRESFIWELACREGLVSIDNRENWCSDPYDKDFKRTFLMNM